jgi:hypothetical protein
MKKLNKFFSHYRFTVTLLLLMSCINGKNKDSQNNSDSSANILNESAYVKNNQESHYVIDSLNVHETLGGWLKESVGQEIIIDNIGIPENKSEEEYWDAIGLFVQNWEYKKMGLFLDMKSKAKGGSKTVLSILVVSPCLLKTTKKIGIGSHENLVRERYLNNIDKSDSNDSTIVVGSIYGGTIFTIKNGLISEIFIGAIAE